MKIGITPCSASNGSAISEYKLEMKEISSGTYAQVKVFAVTETLEVQLTKLANSMTTGKKYFFRYTAKNTVGYSAISDESVFALAAYPAAPSAPSKDDSKSSLTSIYVSWPLVADGDIVTLGYRLYIDSGNDGNYTRILDG